MHRHIIKYILKNQVILALFLILLGWFIYEIKEILVAVFIAYIIMAALSPFVHTLRQQGIPKVLAVITAYFITLAILGLLIFPLIPFFTSQIESLFIGFPIYLDQAAKLLGVNLDVSKFDTFITNEVSSIGSNALFLTSKVFGGLFSLLTILVVSFYLLLDHDKLKRNISNFFPEDLQETTYSILTKVEVKLGAWLRGQFVLCLFIGVITWTALTALGLEFALPLALLAGFLEIVPTVGPIIASIPAIIVALTVSPTLALFVMILYIVIQALENNLLVPKIMQRAVGLNPIIIIIAIMTGARLMGVIGALLSIPFVTMMVIIFTNLQEE